MVIELRAAKERIDLLEKELKSVDNYNNAQNKILNSTIEKFENDMKRANENEAIIRKRNFDLLEKMKIIERQLIIYENNENGEKIVPQKGRATHKTKQNKTRKMIRQV